MPRVTLYVPDDLKARMDKAGDAVNWSAVAQQAFIQAIVSHNVKKEPTNMTKVVERLRASKERVEVKEVEFGQRRGSQWAKEAAEYDELKRISEFDESQNDGDVETLCSLIDPEDNLTGRDWTQFWERWADRPAITDAFARGFITGAAAVFAEVEDEL